MGFAWDITADVARHDDALDYFGKRTVITSDDARKLDARTKADAFWVGGGLQAAQVQRVFDEIKVAIEKGEDLVAFKARVKGLLSDPAHVETVFRNATQRAYNAGRYAQMKEPSTAKFRPWWLYDAVLDGRTTVEICVPRNGTLLPHDDPWWDTNVPPLHMRCRSSIRNLRRADAERRGGAKPAPESAEQPADGWGTSPALATQWKPDPAKHDASLIAALNKKAPKGTKTRKPRTPKEHQPKHWRSKYAPYGDAADSLSEGKAAYERGLDMTVAAARKELRKVDAPGAKAMLEALEDTDAKRTLRDQTGETDPLRKVAAALAGHLRDLPTRSAVKHAALGKTEIGRRALKFFGQVTGPGVQHPEAWSFRLVKRRGYASKGKQRIAYRAVDGILEHEWGHALEYLNPELLTRSRAFWSTRTAGLKHRKLRAMLPGHGYKADEIAIEDGFAHGYIGKDYGPDATEITSMGLQVLFAGKASWGTLETLAVKDFEHLLFLIGQLKGT